MKFKSASILTILLWLSTLLTVTFSQDKRAITFDDVMKFKQIKKSVISDYGSWIAYTANPDRGNGEVVIKSIETGKEYTFDRGSKTIFSSDEKWAAVTLLDDFIKREKKSSKQKDLLFLNLDNGDTLSVKKYPNKLDYSIKMREFIDHYCKDTPASDWMTKGEPYNGE